MGSITSPPQSQIQTTWIQSQHILSHLPGSPKLVTSSYSSSIHAQKYINQMLNTNQQQQTIIYKQRKIGSQNIIGVYDFQINKGLLGCARNSNIYSIITEHVRYRLEDFGKIGLGVHQILYVFYQALNGFKELGRYEKVCYPNGRMIGIKDNGDVKVWINQNWSLNAYNKCRSQWASVQALWNTIKMYAFGEKQQKSGKQTKMHEIQEINSKIYAISNKNNTGNKNYPNGSMVSNNGTNYQYQNNNNRDSIGFEDIISILGNNYSKRILQGKFQLQKRIKELQNQNIHKIAQPKLITNQPLIRPRAFSQQLRKPSLMHGGNYNINGYGVHGYQGSQPVFFMNNVGTLATPLATGGKDMSFNDGANMLNKSKVGNVQKYSFFYENVHNDQQYQQKPKSVSLIMKSSGITSPNILYPEPHFYSQKNQNHLPIRNILTKSSVNPTPPQTTVVHSTNSHPHSHSHSHPQQKNPNYQSSSATNKQYSNISQSPNITHKINQSPQPSGSGPSHTNHQNMLKPGNQFTKKVGYETVDNQINLPFFRDSSNKKVNFSYKNSQFVPDNLMQSVERKNMERSHHNQNNHHNQYSIDRNNNNTTLHHSAEMPNIKLNQNRKQPQNQNIIKNNLEQTHPHFYYNPAPQTSTISKHLQHFQLSPLQPHHKNQPSQPSIQPFDLDLNLQNIISKQYQPSSYPYVQPRNLNNQQNIANSKQIYSERVPYIQLERQREILQHNYKTDRQRDRDRNWNKSNRSTNQYGSGSGYSPYSHAGQGGSFRLSSETAQGNPNTVMINQVFMSPEKNNKTQYEQKSSESKKVAQEFKYYLRSIEKSPRKQQSPTKQNAITQIENWQSQNGVHQQEIQRKIKNVYECQNPTIPERWQQEESLSQNMEIVG